MNDDKLDVLLKIIDEPVTTARVQRVRYSILAKASSRHRGVRFSLLRFEPAFLFASMLIGIIAAGSIPFSDLENQSFGSTPFDTHQDSFIGNPYEDLS